MTFLLKALLRGQRGEQARAEGFLPAVIYGANGETQSLSLVQKEFEKLFAAAGESSLIDLELDGKAAGKVLVQEIQYDPTTDRMIHVDLRRIDMNKPIEAHVELRFVGESPAVKGLGGTFVHNLDEVEVRCLPKDLVAHLDIDISTLKTFDDSIKVKDIQLPAGVEIVNPHAEDLVAKAQPALTEEQIKAMEEASKAPVDLSKIESAAKKKEEDGEEGGEEGADKKDEKKEEKK